MQFFGFSLTFSSSSNPQYSPVTQDSEAPPAYVSLYPADIKAASLSSSPYSSDLKPTSARPFPTDWQTSLAPPNSVLRGNPRLDENQARRA